MISFGLFPRRLPVALAALSLLAAILYFPVAMAEQALVAVASNFYVPAQRLTQEFALVSEHRVALSSGSTGKLYAQIIHGGPYDIFLSADTDKPQRLIDSNIAVATSQFTYAEGQLALYSSRKDLVDSSGAILRQSDAYRYLAIANPDVAPYGLAAMQVIEKLELTDRVSSKLIYGENISQTYQFVDSGNAQLGFIALAQLDDEAKRRGSWWLVPTALHAPIKQNAVLLARGKSNAAALEFLQFLQSPAAKKIIVEAGYSVE